MSPPVAPQGDYAELSQLAARISQHLLKHPRDSQARQDLQYVITQMQGPAGATRAANVEERAAMVGPESAHPGAEVTAGVTQAALDLPRGILQAVTHPIHTAGQLTGVGNWGRAVQTFRDPEANTAEKLDALFRSFPTNIGYAPERGLLEATGAKADTPASVEEQAHRAGNVASLMLLGVNRNTPGVRMAGRVAGRIPIVGPLGRAAVAAVRRAGEPPPEVPVGAPAPAPGTWSPEAALRLGVKPENVEAFLALQRRSAVPPRAAPEPLDVPTFMRRAPPAPLENAGLLAPSPRSAPYVAGRAAIPGKPELGLLAPAGEYQTAGSSLRTASPATPMAGPLGASQQIALQVRLARAMGMTEAAIARRLASLGITPQQVQAALR